MQIGRTSFRIMTSALASFICGSLIVYYKVPASHLELDNTNDHGTSTLCQNLSFPYLVIYIRLVMVILPSRTVNTGATPLKQLSWPL